MALSDSIARLQEPSHTMFMEAGEACFGPFGRREQARRFVGLVRNMAWTSAAELLLPEWWRVMPAIQHRDGSWAVSLINDQIDGVVTGKGAALSCAMVVACLKVRGL